jgi:hypothetical protein
MGLLDKLELRTESEPDDDSQIVPVFEPDPEPGERPSRRRRTRRTATVPARTTSKASTTKMAKEVSEDLASLIEMTAAVWGMSDQCCSPVLERQAKPIAESLVAILARNPRLLAKFASTDLVAYSVQAGLLFKAFKPVVTTVYANHVSKAVDDEDQGDAVNGAAIRLANYPAYAGR